jgi:hypothetical protein
MERKSTVVIYHNTIELIVGEASDHSGECFTASGKVLPMKECEWPPFDDEQAALIQDEAVHMLWTREMNVAEAGIVLADSTLPERNAALGSVALDTAMEEGDVDAIIVAIATFALACRAAGQNDGEG